MERYRQRNYSKEKKQPKKQKSDGQITTSRWKPYASLKTHHPLNVEVKAGREETFYIRSTADSQVLTPLVKQPLIQPSHGPDGTLGGGTSKEATRNARRSIRLNP